MYDTILVATDGSPAAETAAEGAVALAERFDATIHAVHVMEAGDLPAGVEDGAADEFARRGEEALAAIADAAADAGVAATTVHLSGKAVHRTIVDYADEHADLVVMGTAGRTGLDRFVLGSVAERTLRATPVPVLTVHEDTPVDPDLGSLVVPTDGSAPAQEAASHAIDLAAESGATLHVVHVVDVGVVHDEVGADTILDALEEAGQAAVDEVISMAEEAGIDGVEATILSGRPAGAIVEYAADVDADAIVVGTHGRSGFDRLLLGSVTERVVRTAETPVLVVGPPEA